ncbi:multicomponent Na+:H+ antiporter subunit F [Hoeflea halophila]|uniref:Multicomponent Na+:H+ antiporter subunit F n=1 Tax=Hoeflea halophila TaxID=714899 RepID=A0A286IBL9_9HYPH|nr:cation:proton antiporter [Hoeflea halophila]SOE17500.1 multicomponent Na+:H+ antiporter subunit F [Hoeflea halophila]
MISVAAIFDSAVTLALAILSLSFLVTIYRIVKGPTLPDRILGLDMLVAIAIGFIAVIGIKTGYTLYVDVAIALGLVGFLATVAFARFVLSRGKTEDDIITEARQAAAAARKAALSAGPDAKARTATAPSSGDNKISGRQDHE